MNTSVLVSHNTGPIQSPAQRIAWVDYAKGICIIMVVMMHSTLDYGAAAGNEGWLHHVVAFARPFRMPDFFLLAGLFLSASINSPWREYLDRKVVHFIYFYLIWLLIQMGVTESGLLLSDPARFISLYFFAWAEPINTLWFVHMLAIFYLVTRLLRHVSVLLVFVAAAGLQIAFQLDWIGTGWSVIGRFFDHYVYFFTGYAAAAWIFSFARQIPSWRKAAITGLVLWAMVNAGFTVAGSDQAPGIGLLLGFLGAVAIVTAGSLLAGYRQANFLRYCGANSIVIYLSFFLPMKIALRILADTGVIADVGWASLLITCIAVVMPLLFFLLVRDSWLVFLYRRPAALRWGVREGQAARL